MSVGVGFNVATFDAYETVAVTTLFAESRNTNVPVVIVDEFIASLKVAVTFAVPLIPVAPAAGDVDVTVGAVVSANIVNVHTLSAANGLPARSLTPAAPPKTVPV